jgi:hypothetical protein
MNKCIKCDVELEVDKNWYRSRMKCNGYICIPCHIAKAAEQAKHQMYVNGKRISVKHPLHKPGRYKTFSDAAFEGTYKADSIKEGYVYAITNRAWPNWVKIGMAIDAEDRLSGYQTSSPYRDYVLEHTVASNDRRKSEKEAHTRALPLATDSKGEWFKLSVEQAITILDNLNEYGHARPTKKADTHKEEDNIQGSLF